MMADWKTESYFVKRFNTHEGWCTTVDATRISVILRATNQIARCTAPSLILFLALMWNEVMMMAGDGWESRVVITTFEMKDGPVKNRILFCQESQHPQRMRHHSWHDHDTSLTQSNQSNRQMHHPLARFDPCIMMWTDALTGEQCFVISLVVWEEVSCRIASFVWTKTEHYDTICYI